MVILSPPRLVEPVGKMAPTEIHLKQNGAVDDTPSVAIIFDAPIENPAFRIVGEVSLKMLMQAFDELGYILTPKITVEKT